MLWDFVIKAFVLQLILLIISAFLISTLSFNTRSFLSKHWKIFSYIIWAITFVVSLALGGFLLGLLIATTTTALLGLLVKLFKVFNRPRK